MGLGYLHYCGLVSRERFKTLWSGLFFRRTDFVFYCGVISSILSLSYNATREGPEFYMTNYYRTVYARKFAQLITNNNLFTENTLSAAWFGDFQSDCWVPGPCEGSENEKVQMRGVT